MRVELTDALVSGRHDPLLVLGLLAMGVTGRHRVLCQPEAITEWLEALPPDLRDEIEIAIELSEHAEAVGPPVDEVIVHETPSLFADNPPRLSPADAANVLARPLQVVVENGENDRDFLLAFAPRATREALEEAVSNGWLEFWNGGGIDGCLAKARQLAVPSPATLRVRVLCDSDARVPRKPSQEAQDVRRALDTTCTAHGRSEGDFGAVLSRRSVENYLPAKDFAEWLARNWNEDKRAEVDQMLTDQNAEKVRELDRGDERRVWICARVLADTTEEFREHYDMNFGAKNSKGAWRTDKLLWGALTAWQQTALHDGVLKTNVRRYYAEARELTEPSGEIHGLLSLIRRAV